MYLQLPVMIAYHFRLGRATTLQPFVGGYHSVGISCKLKEEYSGRITGTATTDSAKRKTTRPPGFRENARRNTKNPLRIPEGIFTIGAAAASNGACRRNLFVNFPACGFQRILHQRDDRHRPDAAGNRRK